MVAKRLLLWMVPVILVLAALFVLVNDDTRDWLLWTRFRSQLNADRISKVEVSGPGKKIVLTEDERRQVLEWLREARFERSNRVGHGPTAEVLLILFSPAFKNGWVSVGFWGGHTFETGARNLDPRSQFLVESEPLGQWLREKFSIRK